MDKGKVDKLLMDASFRFAKSMPKFPHYYTLRNTWINDSEFVDVVLFMRANGIVEKWNNRNFVYDYANGFKYWTMGNPVCYEDKSKTILINRVSV